MHCQPIRQTLLPFVAAYCLGPVNQNFEITRRALVDAGSDLLELRPLIIHGFHWKIYSTMKPQTYTKDAYCAANVPTQTITNAVDPIT